MINKKEFIQIDVATDELAEVLADFDLNDEELVEVRSVISEIKNP